jgi:N-acetyl-anhydromuramyl-L-alanine amidase AmpD
MKDLQAVWNPSPNFWAGRAGYTPKWIILHGTAGGGAVSWLDNPVSQVSAHYVITEDGVIHQLVDEQDTAWANGVLTGNHDTWWDSAINPNYQTISIEHEKADPTNALALTAAQQSASFVLIGRICQRWSIPAQLATANGGITGHFSIDPVNRSQCPGNYPWSALWAALQPHTNESDSPMLQLSEPIGKYYDQSGAAAWTRRGTNIVLHDANLAFYRQYGGIFGLALTNEIRLSQYPDAAIVVCERGILAYDPKRQMDNPPGAGSVYLLHLDKGVGQQLVSKPLTEELQAQITSLQAQIKAAPESSDLEKFQAQLTSYKKAITAIDAAIQAI